MNLNAYYGITPSLRTIPWVGPTPRNVRRRTHTILKPSHGRASPLSTTTPGWGMAAYAIGLRKETNSRVCTLGAAYCEIKYIDFTSTCSKYDAFCSSEEHSQLPITKTSATKPSFWESLSKLNISQEYYQYSVLIQTHMCQIQDQRICPQSYLPSETPNM